MSGSRCAAQPVKIFTEIIGNWRKVEIFNRIEKILVVKQQRQEECLGESWKPGLLLGTRPFLTVKSTD